MTLFTVLSIAVGLAMDAFAVSITSGAAARTSTGLRYPFKIALYFGLFQAVMPVIGWLAGFSLNSYIDSIDHWIAFGLLCFVGGKMIIESREMKDENVESAYMSSYLLFTLAIATSIDAMAVGITLSFLDINIIRPVVIIGLVTFVMTFTGFFIGQKTRHIFSDKIEIIGGLILIAIGIKIVVQHFIP